MQISGHTCAGEWQQFLLYLPFWVSLQILVVAQLHTAKTKFYSISYQAGIFITRRISLIATDMVQASKFPAQERVSWLGSIQIHYMLTHPKIMCSQTVTSSF